MTRQGPGKPDTREDNMLELLMLAETASGIGFVAVVTFAGLHALWCEDQRRGAGL